MLCRSCTHLHFYIHVQCTCNDTHTIPSQTHTHMHARAHTNTRTHTQYYMYLHMHTHTHIAHTHTHTHTHTCTIDIPLHSLPNSPLAMFIQSSCSVLLTSVPFLLRISRLTNTNSNPHLLHSTSSPGKIHKYAGRYIHVHVHVSSNLT